MNPLSRRATVPAAFAWLASAACAQATSPSTTEAEPASQIRQLGTVVVNGGRASSLPSQIPTTLETVDAERIATTVNATDSEDALKYFPSLLVRKRYIGDYNHAVLSTWASGTGNSARSLVYADGILLSNLLGNGATFAPRWGLVTPEEIERVDVLYGPFSAAYPGNSAGAVVDYLTRMPTRFEVHAAVGGFAQPFDLYGTHETYTGWQTSLSLGNRSDGLSWWLTASRLDSEGQPLVFDTTATPTPGAVPALDRTGKPWYIRGTSTQYRTVQDHLKLKLAYDLSPELRASYTAGWWRNEAQGYAQSYVNPGQAGLTNVDGLEHTMHAVSLKRHAGDTFDWELAASLYRYGRDDVRKPATALPENTGPGTLADQRGTGWNTLAARGTWRPDGVAGPHVIDGGLQQDSFHLRTATRAASDWTGPADGATTGRFDGDTRLRSAYLQDAWRFTEDWMTVLGLRAEHWQAFDGHTQTGANAYEHPSRSRTAWSPKAALSHQVAEGWTLKASTGRAWRFPTVSELYQGAATATGISTIANADLRPERSWTSELSSEWSPSEASTLRVTLFHEDTRDAIYSQAVAGAATPTNSVQNVDHVRTVGLETAWQGRDVALRGLDLQGSVTFADSKIVANSGYVSVPGDTVGRWQPRVPRWRATAVATWRADDRWSVSYAARYSGVQYSSLDNTDTNGFAYTAASKYFTTDLRLRYAIDRQWHVALGIDNLNDYQYWNFHPYPQRTYSAELKFDY